MVPTTRPESRRIPFAAGALLGLAMLLLIRRYAGIEHDSPLYLGQALLQDSPEIFGKDLFFLHGSQGSYTLFPRLLASSFDWFSPPDAFLWGALASMLCFAGAAWYCLHALLPERQRYWAWLGVLCLPTFYGMTWMFNYHEPILTPRPFAEALCLLGIGLLARERLATALACIAMAGVLHPLQAIASLLIVWPWLVLRDRRWRHALWLAIPVALLGFAGIRPFDGLLHSMDAAWLGEAYQFTRQLFVSGWTEADYKVLGFDMFLLACAWRTLHGPFGQWCRAALIGLALGLGASLVLVDWLHLVLPAGLQLWRVHWLAHWLAMAACAALLFRDAEARSIPRALCLGLAALLAWGIAGGWLWFPFALLYAGWSAISSRVQPRVTTLLGALFAAGMTLLLVHHLLSELLPFRVAHYRLELYAFDRRILAYPLVALGLPLLCVSLWNRLVPRHHWLLAAGILCPLVAVSVWRWDTRSPVTLAFEHNALHADLFGIALPENAQVFWDTDNIVGTWLVLHRASYFSWRQLSGLVFNRGTAMDARQRLNRIDPILQESEHCRDRSIPLEEREHCRISDAGMQRACAPGPIAKPDYLILPYRQRQRALGSWSIIDPATGEPAITYWLYDCRDVIEIPGPAVSPSVTELR